MNFASLGQMLRMESFFCIIRTNFYYLIMILLSLYLDFIDMEFYQEVEISTPKSFHFIDARRTFFSPFFKNLKGQSLNEQIVHRHWKFGCIHAKSFYLQKNLQCDSTEKC